MLSQLIDSEGESAKIEATRASPSGKALAFQANIRRFESDRPLFYPRIQLIEQADRLLCLFDQLDPDKQQGLFNFAEYLLLKK